jgi:hypothetical protein
MARDLGAATARAEDAGAKIVRMTSRPRLGGRFVSADDAQRRADSVD